MKVHLCSGVWEGLTEETAVPQTWGRTHIISGQTPQAPATWIITWLCHGLGLGKGAAALDSLQGRAGKNSPGEWTLTWEQLSGETLLGKARDRQGCQLCPCMGRRTHINHWVFQWAHLSTELLQVVELCQSQSRALWVQWIAAVKASLNSWPSENPVSFDANYRFHPFIFSTVWYVSEIPVYSYLERNA